MFSSGSYRHGVMKMHWNSEKFYKALLDWGKFIACYPVLQKYIDDSHRTRALLEGDIFVMKIYSSRFKECTE